MTLRLCRWRAGQIVVCRDQAQPSVKRPRPIAAIVRMAADLVVVDVDIDGEVDSASSHRPSIGHQPAPYIVATPRRHPQRLNRGPRRATARYTEALASSARHEIPSFR